VIIGPREDPRLLAADLVEAARAAGVRLATAESLTGGLLAATIVAVPGASSVFRGGVIAYATDLKAAWLGVDNALLDVRGPVDPDVALAMAAGVRLRASADLGMSTTGVAGPGPADGRPSGTVHLGVSGPGGDRVRSLVLGGDREAIRRGSVHALLRLALEALPPAARAAHGEP
jgi:nicotinamide-nucleotide amidase